MSQELRRILRSHQVLSISGFSAMHVSRLEKAGKFPRRFKLASDAKTGAVGWWQDEIEDWLRQRDKTRQKQSQPEATA